MTVLHALAGEGRGGGEGVLNSIQETEGVSELPQFVLCMLVCTVLCTVQGACVHDSESSCWMPATALLGRLLEGVAKMGARLRVRVWGNQVRVSE